MPNAIKGVRDYRNTIVYHLKAVIPGVNVTVTMLTPGLQPTSSASVADDGTVTIALGIPSAMGIKDVSISQDGIITVTMDDDSTETFDGLKTAIAAASQATTEANNAASDAIRAAGDANAAAGGANDATTAATNAATAANNAAQTALASVGNMLVGEYEDATGGQMFTTEDAYATGTLHELMVYGKSEQATTTGKNLIDQSLFLNCPGWHESNGAYEGLLNTLGATYGPNGSLGYMTDGFTFLENTVYTVSVYLTLSPNDTGTSTNKAVYLVFSYTDDTVSRAAFEASSTETRFSATSTAEKTVNHVYITYGGNHTVIFRNLQLELGSTVTEYEPYTERVPSPNPDYPQEIKSVADGIIQFSGKNLFNTASKRQTVVRGITSSYDSATGVFLANGTVEDTALIDFSFDLIEPFKCPNNTNLTFSCDGIFNFTTGTNFAIFLRDVNGNYFEYSYIRNGIYNPITFTLAGGRTIDKVLIRYGASEITRTVNINARIQLEFGNVATNFELSLLRKTLDFLPVGIEPLRSLPDGTRDVLRIDKDGNGVIERIVGIYNLKNKPNWSMTVYGNFNRFNPQSTITDAIKTTARSSNVFSDYFLHSSDPISNPAKSNTIALYNALPYILVDMESYPDVASFKALIDDIDPILLYQLATPTTETIPAAVMPQIPSEYLNAWLDASDQDGDLIDPAWSMKYECDLTIVINSIESAIADIVTGE